jgi:hypothetical protein
MSPSTQPAPQYSVNHFLTDYELLVQLHARLVAVPAKAMLNQDVVLTLGDPGEIAFRYFPFRLWKSRK